MRVLYDTVFGIVLYGIEIFVSEIAQKLHETDHISTGHTRIWYGYCHDI